MASSRYLLELEESQKRLSVDLLQCILKDVVTEKDDPENFSHALQFCLDTFQNRQNKWKTPVIEINQLREITQSLCMKLSIHSFHEKAERLSKLFDILLCRSTAQIPHANEGSGKKSGDRTGWPDSVHEKRQAQTENLVSVINLLLLLSNSPTKFPQDLGIENQNENGNDFSFGQSKCEDDYYYDEDDNDDENENDDDDNDDDGIRNWLEDYNEDVGSDDESEDESKRSCINTYKDSEKCNGQTRSEEGLVPSLHDGVHINLYHNHQTIDGDNCNTEKALRYTIPGKNLRLVNLKHPCSVASFVREKLVRSYSQIQNQSKNTLVSRELVERINIISELKLMRSIIYAFHGIDSPGILRVSAEGDGNILVTPCSNTNTLVYTSPTTLNSILSFTCKGATLLCRIRSFTDAHKCGGGNATKSTFSFAIKKEIDHVVEYLDNIEASIQEPGDSIVMNESFVPTPTIALLVYWLTPLVDRLEQLFKLVNGIQNSCAQSKTEEEEEIACTILNQLYTRWKESWICSVDHSCISTEKDTHKEERERNPSRNSILGRTNSRVLMCESFHTALCRIFFIVLRPLLKMVNDLIYSGRLYNKTSEFFIKRTTTASRGESIAWTMHEEYVPGFLRPLSAKILNCGRSVRLLSKQICKNFDFDPDLPLDLDLDKNESESCFNLLETKFMSCVAEKRKINDIKQPDVFLDRCLFSHIRKQCKLVNCKIMSALVKTGNLQKWTEILRDIFLLQNESLLLSFLYDLFQAADDNSQRSTCRIPIGPVALERESGEGIKGLEKALTANLQNDMANEHGYDEKFIESVSVRIEKDLLQGKPVGKTRLNKVLHAIDLIELHCKVPTPYDVIIDGYSMALLRQIFRFLIKVKQANYQLNQIQHSLRRLVLSRFHFHNKEKRADNVGVASSSKFYKQLHLLSMMIMEKLHFVRNLHDCTMHRLVDVSWNFQKEIKEAVDIEHLRQIHKCYMEKICACCLLSPLRRDSINPVLDATLEILATCLRFKSLAETMVLKVFNEERSMDIDDVHWKELTSLNQRFKNAKKFMQKLMEKPNFYDPITKAFLQILGL